MDEDQTPELPRDTVEGLLIGPPFAMATDCDLLPRADKQRVPGCCASVKCDSCGQRFRIDLLSTAGNHACPQCKLEYTSLLIVATADDHTILQAALEVILRHNGLALAGGAHSAEDEYDDDDDDPDDPPDDPDVADEKVSG